MVCMVELGSGLLRMDLHCLLATQRQLNCSFVQCICVKPLVNVFLITAADGVGLLTEF